MKTFLSLIALPLALIGASPARADDLQGVLFAGGTASASPSAYGGALAALPGGRLGEGLALRVTVNAGRYEYDRAASRVQGQYTGGEAALVQQFSGPWGWANLSAGPRVTHTSLSPGDPDNANRGTRFDLGLQTDGALNPPHWQLGWRASYAPHGAAYEMQLRLARKVGDERRRIGIEAGILGDPSFRQESLGGTLALPLGKRAELHFGSGAVFEEGRKPRPYAALGTSSVF